MGGRIGEVNEDVVFDCWGFEMSDEKQVGENRWVSLYFLSKVDAPTTIDGFTVSTRDATMQVLPRWDRFGRVTIVACFGIYSFSVLIVIVSSKRLGVR
jgi:hypothetical protein